MVQNATYGEELRRQVGALFRPSSVSGVGIPPRVGLELELFVVELDGACPDPVSVPRIRRALRGDDLLWRVGKVTFEPGGQLELSPGPQSRVTSLLATADALVNRARAALDRDGLGVEAVGLDPRPAAGGDALQEATERYRVMSQYFDTLGPAGRRMMCRSAALQVSVDLTPGPSATQQWVVANMIGPALAVAFRNPPTRDNRTAVWRSVDASRTGFDGRQVDSDRPIDAYVRFAERAVAMPMTRLGDTGQRLPTAHLSEWASHGSARPDSQDIAHHLSTLFPPVRPRGYLEVRFLDSQPVPRLRTAVSLLAILLADPQARALSAEITGSDPSVLEASWRRSAEDGAEDDGLRATATDLVLMAAGRVATLTELWPGWLPDDTESDLVSFASSISCERPAGGLRGEAPATAPLVTCSAGSQT